MSTNARIGVENEDGTVTSAYTHWDGYPSHHAPILSEHYADPAKLRELLALGDLSSLAPEIGEQHDFESREHPGWCLFYARDRGETDVAAKTHPIDAWPDYGQAFEYLLKPNGWHGREVKHEKIPTPDDPNYEHRFERVESPWLALADLLAAHPE